MAARSDLSGASLDATQFLAILDATGDGLCVLDREGRFTYANRSCEAYLGWHTELVGRAAWDVFASFGGGHLEQRLRRVLETGIPDEIEIRSARQPERWMEVSAVPMKEGIGIFFRDITGRRKAQEALIQSEERFRSLVEATTAIVWVTPISGEFDSPQPGWSAFTGQTFEELKGWGWLSAVHPDDQLHTATLWAQAVEERTPYRVEHRLRYWDGTYRHMVGRAVPISEPDGLVREYVGIHTDVTEQRATEEALRRLNGELERRVEERSRELDRIFRMSLDILGVCDFDGRFLSMSPAWERITGRPVADILRRSVKEFIHPEDYERSAAEFQRLLRGETISGYENRYLHVDGTYRRLSWSMAPVMDEKLIYVVARDVTEERLKDEQIRQAQKMEAVGQLTGGMAHDFNNLLQALSSCLQMLARRPDEQRVDNLIQAGLQAVDRGARLVQQLMTFARRQALRPEPMDVRDRIVGMSELLARALRADIDLVIDLEPGLWPVEVDPTQFELAVINLAVNARDAMPDGGTFRLEAANQMLIPGNPIGLHGDFVRFSIRDSGVGMSPDVLARAFDPFFTTKEVGKGSGLGLSQVYGFVRQSGGTVWIESAPGQGTAVNLLLPRSLSQPAEALPDRPDMVPSRGTRILFVDDDPVMSDLVGAALVDLGYQIMRAGTADEAMKRLESGEAVDLLFSDVVMPGGMSGVALAREARRLRPDLPVVLTTGYSEDVIDTDGLRVLPKPYRIEALVEAIEMTLGQS